MIDMQILVNGFVLGLAIALLAAAFQLVYLPTRVFFLALAALFTLAPYLVKASYALFGSWVLSVAIALAGVCALSISCELFNHARLARRGASDGSHLLSSLGTYILFVQIAAMAWGSGTQTLRTAADTPVQVGDIVLTYSQLVTASVAGALLVGFVTLLWTTALGLRLRALANSAEQFARYGYDPGIHRLTAFGLAGLLAACASLVTAYDIGFDLYGGLHVVLLAVSAVIIGGRTSFIGPIAGGILLGLVREQVSWNLSALWQDAATFLLLAAFLLLRPAGLFGHKTRIESVAS